MPVHNSRVQRMQEASRCHNGYPGKVAITIVPVSKRLITGETDIPKISMKKSLVILAGFACIMMIAAGCTSTPGTAPATTPAATAPVSANESWSGTWNTSYSSTEYGYVVERLTLAQTGSSVTGTYNDGNGTVNATVQGNKLAGTWSDSNETAEFAGLFEFVLAADGSSFTGKWVSASESPDAIKNTTQTWNGVRE